MATSTTRAAEQAARSAATEAPEGAHKAASHDSSAEEVERLRDELDSLNLEPVAPALGGAVGSVEDFGRRVRGAFEQELATLSDIVQGRPLLAVGVAGATGYLLGRLGHSQILLDPRRRTVMARVRPRPA